VADIRTEQVRTIQYPLGQKQLPCKHETKWCEQDNKLLLLLLLEHLYHRKRLDLHHGLRQRNKGEKIVAAVASSFTVEGKKRNERRKQQLLIQHF